MNGARSTFKRKGYLLTALAAAVLLAASPGTASAQSVGFVGSSGSVAEAATSATTTPNALTVSVRAAGLPATPEADRTAAVAKLGTVGVAVPEGISVSVKTEGGGESATSLNFSKSDTIVLSILPGSTDGNWKSEMYSLKLSATGGGGHTPSVTTDVFRVTVVDDEVAPVAKFEHTNAPNITLQESSSTNITVAIDAGTKTEMMQGVMATAPALSIMGTGAVDKVGPCATAGNFLEIMDMTFDSKGVATLAVPSGSNLKSIATVDTLAVTACEDLSNFRDQSVTLSFTSKSLMTADGAISDGGSITITVDSNEETPTVEFATTDINIDEGGTQSVYLVADTMQGDEVGMATIMVSGDARVSLSGSNVTAGDDVDAYGNGSYTVEFGKSANTSVTFSAAGDESLGDGETKMAMATISSANGANIGTDDTLNITVRGSTSVPALPLVGQLLLALFLMAGGSRLYRRRRG